MTSRRFERGERSGREEERRALWEAESFLREGRVVREMGREVRVLWETTVKYTGLGGAVWDR